MFPMPKTVPSCANLLAASKIRPFPSVALRLMTLLQKDTISLTEVGRVLETDAALSATVLRAANSPLFTARNEIKSIPLALAMLGMERVSLLTLTAAVLHTLPGSVNRDYTRAWWRHNLAAALLSKHLSPKNMVAEYCYMCGMLHSVGQLLLLEAFPARYDRLMEETATTGVKLLESERDAFGADHCELGAALLKKWNIPEEMVDAASHYCDPLHARCKSTAIVHTACVVADHLGFALKPQLCIAVEDLAKPAQETLKNDPLCLEITQKVEAIEHNLIG
jgi:HD-like signal output (HDOD) protein